MLRESCLRKESLFSGLADTAERRAEDQSGQGSGDQPCAQPGEGEAGFQRLGDGGGLDQVAPG